MIGQEAVTSPRLPEVVPLPVILTKIEGDARGGAAIQSSVTGVPIKFLAPVRRWEAIEVTTRNRWRRILGWAITGLIERAEAA